MICYQNVAGLAIETTIGSSAGLVFGTLTGEGKVNRKTLPRDRSLAGAVGGARRGLLQFGSKANRTGVKDWVGLLKMRDANNTLVGGVEIRVTGMTEALMPQQSFGARVKLTKTKLLNGTGRRAIDCCKKSVDVHIRSVSGKVVRGSGNSWKHNGRRVAQSMLESTMELNIFGLSKFVVHNEGEDAGAGELV
jgi:hypothetical protein